MNPSGRVCGSIRLICLFVCFVYLFFVSSSFFHSLHFHFVIKIKQYSKTQSFLVHVFPFSKNENYVRICICLYSFVWKISKDGFPNAMYVSQHVNLFKTEQKWISKDVEEEVEKIIKTNKIFHPYNGWKQFEIWTAHFFVSFHFLFYALCALRNHHLFSNKFI